MEASEKAIKYKEKIVCFIDILGFSDLVKGKTFVEIYGILSSIRQAIEDEFNIKYPNIDDLEITQFSDSIVLSFSPNQLALLQLDFFKRLCVKMIDKGIVFRGGITYGDVFHDKEHIFGPAMIKAHYLESKIAESPRIILDSEVLNAKLKFGNHGQFETLNDYPGNFIIHNGNPDYPHIDYFNDVLGIDGPVEDYYKKLQNLITQGLNHSDSSVIKKYEWMKQEFNQALRKVNLDAAIEKSLIIS